ncbi:hypothetical protein HDR68_00520 [bacterium]|nr:hypothetical protein [bacterium]
MKKLILLSCFVLSFGAVLFTSCGKESDELFKEPFVKFGATKSEVKSAWSSYSLLSETDEALVYLGKGNVEFYAYAFNNPTLFGSMVMLKEGTTLDEVRKFLDERYQFIGTTESYLSFISQDGKMLVGAELDGANVNVIYAPWTADKKDSPANTFAAVRNMLVSVD